MILPVVLYGCEIWSLTFREQRNLRVLRRIFGPERDEVMGGCRKLHHKELHNLYTLLSIIRMTKSRRIRWAGHIIRMGEKRNVYVILVGMYFRELEWGGMNWIDLDEDRNQWRALVNMVLNLRVP
jgi:hypothetical protein